METMSIEAYGILWFTNSANYTDYRSICEDAGSMPATYAQWKKKTEHLLVGLLREGKTYIKVKAGADEFRAWCAKTGRDLNAAGRIDFATFKAHEKIGQSHPSQKDQ